MSKSEEAEARAQMSIAERIMVEDREILRSLATISFEEQLEVAHSVVKRRRRALRDLGR